MNDITAPAEQPQPMLRISQLYAALSQINQAIVRVTTREQLFAEICEALVTFGKFKMAWIGWNDPATCTVSVASQYGDTDHYLAGISVRSDDTPEGRGPVGTAIREGTLCVVNDFLQSPITRPWHDAAARCGFRSIGVFPISMDGRVCGALAGYATEIDFFGPQEIELLVKAAADTSFALDHLAGESRRKQAEDTLRKVSRAVEQSPVAISIADRQGRIEYVNPKFTEITGYTSGEVTGEHLRLLHAQDMAPAEHQQLWDTITAGKVWERESRATKKNGEPCWRHSKISPVRDAAGHIDSFVIIEEDVTERRRMDMALEDRDRTLRAFYDGAPLMMGVVELTPGGDIIAVSVNEATASRYHRTAAEVVNLSARDAGMKEDEHATWLSKFREAESTGFPQRFELRGAWHGKPSCLAMVVSLIGRTAEGNPRLCFIGHDVSDRVAAEETIRRQNELHQLVQRATQDAIWDWDLISDTLQWNDSIQNQFGYHADEIPSQLDWWQHNVHRDDVTRVMSGLRHVVDSGGTFWSDEYRFRKGDGSFAHVLDRGYVVHDAQGRPIRMIGAMVDMTERKVGEQTQAALHHISEAAQTASTLPELFRSIHAIIGELLPAENFFVALYDERKDELTFPYYVDEHDGAPAPQGLDDGTLAGRVIRLGEALLFTPETPRAGSHEELAVVGTDSMDWLGVPLKSQSKTIGALVVQSYSGKVRYTEKHKALLDFVSGQVAAAIVRKQSEEALRASEARFRLLFEQNLAGVFRTLPDGLIIDCNDAFAQMLGYGSRAEILGTNSTSLYFEQEDRDSYLSELRARGALINFVARLRRKDGRELWGMETVNLIRNEQGEPEVIQGTLVDFTDRKHAEEALHLSESRLEEAQRLAHLGSWNWDLSSLSLSWSDELCRIFGVDPASHLPSYEDFLGRIHPDDRAFVETLVAQALKDLKPRSYEARIIRPDGEVRTIQDQSEVLVDDSGRARGMTGASLDITRRKMEESLERNRSLILEQVAQNQPLPGILSHIVTMLEMQMPRARCSILLLKDGHLTAGASPHLPPEYSNALEGLPIGPAAGSCGTACFRRETVITPDIAIDPLWDGYRELALPHGLRACWSMPIPSNQDGVLGSLAIYHDQPSSPSERDLGFMEMAARLAAVAIEHRQLTDQLSHQAQHDALTGLPNRLLFQDRLGQAVVQAGRERQQVAVLYMDLDRFKHINDTLGHSSGDALLCQVATRLQGCVRKTDTLARLGGDEFTVVLTGLRDAQDAMQVAEKLIETMRDPFHVEGRELFTSISLGISMYPDDGLDGETLMVNADVAMYRAKDVGRDNFQWFASEMNARARDRMALEGQLRHAMALGQLSLCYQPQCGAMGEIRGFEALMRWRHPELGMVSPARFIPLAEDCGLIVQMGEWALREACAQAAAWRRAGHSELRIAVNVSAAQFRRTDWVDTVRRALRDTRLEPEALELEITESLLLQNVTETSANLFELRKLGVGIAIDDFGTGYSSLSYLHKLPVTTLKIDQSFVREIRGESIPGQEEAPIIRTIIALARNFRMNVVAEGVETEAQRELLLRLGCESLQGYLLHHPLSLEQADALLDAASRESFTATGSLDRRRTTRQS
ncbi:EAL domain-containing protein [Cognatiluteimonas profundi]|uniref:EAL domain-containing protein n=1 Tax=Cognatiluteimonas profundi TaxID=2594501 RepID=UPI00131E87A0|nr:EAL domain-containing protein [Lysobacter profundi]